MRRRRRRGSRLPNMLLTPLRQPFRVVVRGIREVLATETQAYLVFPCNGRLATLPALSSQHVIGLSVPDTITERYRNSIVLGSKMYATIAGTSLNTAGESMPLQFVATMTWGDDLVNLTSSPTAIMNNRNSKRYIMPGNQTKFKVTLPGYSPKRLVPMRSMMNVTNFQLDHGTSAGQPDACPTQCNWVLWRNQLGTGVGSTYYVSFSISYVCMAYNPR